MDFAGSVGELQRRVAESPAGRTRRLAVFEALGPQAGGRYLDIGCGGGHLVRELALAVGEKGRAVGIDVSADQVAAAADYCQGLPAADTRTGDVTALDFAAGSFDGVASIQVLEYVTELDRACAEIRRVLRPGGKAALISILWDAFLFTGAEPELSGRIHQAWRAHCPHQMLPAELPKRLPAAGLNGVTQRPIPFFDTRRHESAYGFWVSKVMAGFAQGQGVSKEDAEAWVAQLDEAERDGRYGFIAVPVLTVATAM